MAKVTKLMENDWMTIFIYDFIHLRIYMPYVYGIQSWAEDENSFRIRYYTKEGNITSIYHNQQLFESVLKAINS
jgi:hypothetical protein